MSKKFIFILIASAMVFVEDCCMESAWSNPFIDAGSIAVQCANVRNGIIHCICGPYCFHSFCEVVFINAQSGQIDQ